jgi:hypothetical protein
LRSTEEAARESVTISRKVLRPGHPDTAERVSSLALIVVRRSRPEEAEALFREAVQASDSPGEDGASAGTDALMARYWLGLLLERRGALEEAEPMLRASEVIVAERFKAGDRHEWVVWAMRSLRGAVLTDAGASDAIPREQRLEKLREAGTLLPAATEQVLALADRIGPRTRRDILPAALARAVRFYSVSNAVDPTPEHAAGLADWEQRQKRYEADAAAAH